MSDWLDTAACVSAYVVSEVWGRPAPSFIQYQV